jgi:hypothetical protein
MKRNNYSMPPKIIAKFTNSLLENHRRKYCEFTKHILGRVNGLVDNWVAVAEMLGCQQAGRQVLLVRGSRPD